MFGEALSVRKLIRRLDSMSARAQSRSGGVATLSSGHGPDRTNGGG